jgi:hypothetical protein
MDFLAEQGSVTRERLFERFRQDPAEDVGAVLNDLVGSAPPRKCFGRAPCFAPARYSTLRFVHQVDGGLVRAEGPASPLSTRFRPLALAR